MDIYTLLRNDHKEADSLFEKLLAVDDEKSQKIYFKELEKALLVHLEAEEEVFYKALLEKESTKSKIVHATQEHKEVEKDFSDIEKLMDEKDSWISQLKKTMKKVKHHVHEEEGNIFDAAKKVLSTDEAKTLGEAMQSLKKKILKAKFKS